MLPGLRLGADAVSRHQGSEVIEIEVKAYRRLIRRNNTNRPAGAACSAIVTAPVPPKIIPKGKYGISIWTELILDKFLYGRPTHRLLQSWEARPGCGAGHRAGGFASLAPLFAPLTKAFRDQQLTDTHWHADETGWKVFEPRRGKENEPLASVGYRSPASSCSDLYLELAQRRCRKPTSTASPKALSFATAIAPIRNWRARRAFCSLFAGRM